MKARAIIIVLFFLCLKLQTSGQETYHVFKSHLIGGVRDEASNPVPDEFDIIGYPASSQVMAIWAQLKTAVITSSNAALINSIQVRSASLQGIYSTNSNGTNLIFYNEDFFNQFQNIQSIDVDYLILFSLAHELGHFIHGDTKYLLRTKESESIADNYACNLLCQMNKATKSSISNVVLALDGANYSNYYFSKGERIKLLNEYFDKGMCVSNVLSDNFETTDNPHNFYVGNYSDFYDASFDIADKQYKLTLDLQKSGWRWTYASFANSYVKIFGSSDHVQFSFDFTSSSAGIDELIGYISQPSCVSQSCPGGSHYDLWFTKSKTAGGAYNLESNFFFNDNCSCNIGNHNNDISKILSTGARSRITIIKHSEAYTILIDGNQAINFSYRGNILSTLLWGAGTHYLSNFQIQVLQ